MKLTITPSGINQDINPAELPPDVWNLGSNVLFRNGFAGSAPGWLEAAPGIISRPLWLLPVFTPGVYYWIYGGNNTLGTAGVLAVTDGTTHWDITPAGGLQVTQAGDWTGGILNGVPVINNRLDPPMYWDKVTLNPAQVLPDWPANTTCDALRPFKYHLIAMAITSPAGQFPDLVQWSAAADPGTIPQEWTATPDNQAGSFSIGSTQGTIIDGGEMRDQFMIYKQDSSSVMQYIAGQFVFSNRKAFVSVGILARNCWAELWGKHYVLTDGDVILHNGQEVQSLIDGQNRNWLFDQMDAENFYQAHLVISHADKQLWINWPKQGNPECDSALVLDIVSGRWGVVDYDEPITFMTRGVLNNPGDDPSFDGQTETFATAEDRFNTRVYNPTTDNLVFCRSADQKVYSVTGFLRDGAPVPVFLQLLSKDMGKPQQYKTVSSMWPLGESDADTTAATLRMRVGVQDEISDPISWSPEINRGDRQKYDYFTTGRFISIEITGDQTGRWRLNSVDIDYNLDGYW